MHDATKETELRDAGKRASERLNYFLMLASRDIQGSRTDQAVTASGPHADQAASRTEARAGHSETELPPPEP
jgi:hypothetical protein